MKKLGVLVAIIVLLLTITGFASANTYTSNVLEGEGLTWKLTDVSVIRTDVEDVIYVGGVQFLGTETTQIDFLEISINNTVNGNNIVLSNEYYADYALTFDEMTQIGIGAGPFIVDNSQGDITLTVSYSLVGLDAIVDEDIVLK